MSERLEAIEEWEKAKVAYDAAKVRLDFCAAALKEMGSFMEAGYTVEVSIVIRETISLRDIRKNLPQIAKTLEENGLVNKSESERLSVKMKEISRDELDH